ncbi:hypothetical protein bcere0022_15900 [Bacillus cereus Rock3-44]|nr:hypothetical protein bcere0022_15900 [Bacillus cereus Rock3-44]
MARRWRKYFLHFFLEFKIGMLFAYINSTKEEEIYLLYKYLFSNVRGRKGEISGG